MQPRQDDHKPDDSGTDRTQPSGEQPVPEREFATPPATLMLLWRHRISSFISILKKIYGEIFHGVRLSPRHTLRAWTGGFTCREYRMYGFEDGRDRNDYLTTRQMLRTGRPNGTFSGAGKSKLALCQIFRNFNIPHPEVVGLIHDDRFHLANDGGTTSLGDFLDIQLDETSLFVKPDWGLGGQHCFLLERKGKSIAFNGEPHDFDQAIERLRALRAFIVTRILDQDAYGAKMFDKTVNSIRLLTLMDPDTHLPFIGGAVQKIGRESSWPVDNFSGGRGGLSVEIDLETGILGPAAMVDDSAKVHWCDSHPDTGTRIQGISIPGWEVITDQFLGYANLFSWMPLIAWDLVPWSNGGVVIEANFGTGTDLFQVHGPMLDNPRNRRFFEYHRII